MPNELDWIDAAISEFDAKSKGLRLDAMGKQLIAQKASDEIDAQREADLQQAMANRVKSIGNAIVPDNPTLRTLTVGPAAGLLGLASEPLRVLDAVAGTNSSDLTNQFADLLSQAAKEKNKEQFAEDAPTWMLDSTTSAISSMSQMIPGVGLANLAKAKGLVNAAKLIPAAFGGSVAANQALTRGKERGLSGSNLAMYATSQGATEFIFEAVPLLKGLGIESAAMREPVSNGIYNALKAFGKDMGVEQIGEMATGLTQAVIDRMSGVDPSALNKKNLTELIRDTAFSVFIMSGVSGASVAKGAISGGNPETDNTRLINALRSGQNQDDVISGFMAANPEAQRAIGALVDPSRKAFTDAGGPSGLSRDQRKAFVEAAKARNDLEPVDNVLPDEPDLSIEQPKKDTDGLTGLLRAESIRAKIAEHEKDPDAAVLFIDIDNFKAVNDVLGHDTGDDTLAAMGALIAESFPGREAGRYGGEEFAVIVKPGEDMDKIKAFLESAPEEIKVNGEPVTISAGLQRGYTVDQRGNKRLAADARLYDAKSSGRNRVAFDKAGKVEYIEGRQIGDKGYVRSHQLQQLGDIAKGLLGKPEALPSDLRDSLGRTIQALSGQRASDVAREADTGQPPAAAVPAAPPATDQVAPPVAPTQPAGDIQPSGPNPVISRSNIVGDVIYLSFDSSSRVPTKSELMEMFRGHNVAITDYRAGLNDVVSGTKSFRVDVLDEHGRSSPKAARIAYDSVIGLPDSYLAKTSVQQKIPLKDRYQKVYDVASGAEQNKQTQPPQKSRGLKSPAPGKPIHIQALSAVTAMPTVARPAAPAPEATAELTPEEQIKKEKGAVGNVPFASPAGQAQKQQAGEQAVQELRVDVLQRIVDSGNMNPDRGELANPGTTDEARTLINKLDQVREYAEEPSVRHDIDVRLQAEEWIAQRSQDAAVAELVNIAKTREFTDVETAVAKLMLSDLATKAWRENNRDLLRDVNALYLAYRDARTETARSLRQGFDPLETPSDRRRRNLIEAILDPGARMKSKIQEAREAGRLDKVKILEEEWARKIEGLRENLMRMGIDMGNLDELSKDPQKSIVVLNGVQALKTWLPAKAFELWRNSILSGPKTHIANTIGNTLYATWRMLGQRSIETLLNKAVKDPKAAQAKEFLYLWAGLLPGIRLGLRHMVSSFRSEMATFEESHNVFTGHDKYTEGSGVAIGGRHGRFIRAPQRALLAADQFAQSIIARMEVGAQAYRLVKEKSAQREKKGQGAYTGEEIARFIASQVANPMSKSWDAALHEARISTFRETETDAAAAVTKAGLYVRKVLPPTFFLLPFVNTPVAIFEAGLLHTPLGLIDTFQKLYKYHRTGNKGGLTRAMGRNVVMAAVIMALMALDDEEDEPAITGAADEFERKYREESRRTFQSQSVRLGDLMLSYARVEPFATTLATMIDLKNAIKEGKPTKISSSLMGQTQEKTFMQGLSDFFDALQQSKAGSFGAFENWMSNFVVSWVPNIIRQPARAIGQKVFPERGLWGKGDERRSLSDRRVAQKTEILTGIYPDIPSYDLWGRTWADSIGGPRTDIMWRMFVPAKSQKVNVFVGDKIIMAWNRQNPDKEWHPVVPDKTYSVDKETKYMTPEQYGEFARLSGVASAKLVEKWRNGVSSDVENKPTEANINAIQKMIGTAREEVKKELVKKWTTGKGEIGSDEEVATGLRKKIIGNAAFNLSGDTKHLDQKEIDDEKALLEGLSNKELMEAFRSSASHRGSDGKPRMKVSYESGSAYQERLARLRSRLKK